MDLYEAMGLLGLESLNDEEYTSKDVEKCFRKQALLHHPDKGGDASEFQRLHTARDLLLQHIAGIGHLPHFHTNSTAVSTSLYEHRTCIRQVLVVCGGKVVAATDDGLIVMELQRETRLERVVSFAAHQQDASFLCCAASHNLVYAGTKDGFVHQIDLSTRELNPWKLSSRNRIVAISALDQWVAVATADREICVLEYSESGVTPTVVWKRSAKQSAKRRPDLSPETILLERGSSPNSLNLWVGGGSDGSDTIGGRLLLWDFDPQVDFFERHETDEMENLFGEFGLTDSDTDSCSSGDGFDKDDDDDGPIIDLVVQEGPVFSLAKHKNTIAVVCGQCIRVWEHRGESKQALVETKTLSTPTKQTLYTVCLNERFLATAGSGESILVWDRETWTLAHHLPLQKSHQGCCLATNCILTLDWFHHHQDNNNDKKNHEDHGDSGVLVSGGYDGVVTMWALANRLEQ